MAKKPTNTQQAAKKTYQGSKNPAPESKRPEPAPIQVTNQPPKKKK